MPKKWITGKRASNHIKYVPLGFVGVESLGFGVLGLMDLRVMSLKGVYRTSGSV